MARGDFKADPRNIVREHRRTYVRAKTGRPRPRDYLTFEGLPVVLFGLCMYFGVQLSPGASVGLLTVSGVLSVFLFGVMVQIWARAMDLADQRPEPGPATSQHAANLEELAANAAYAVLVCIAAAIVFLVASIGANWVLRVSSAVGLAIGVHLVLVLMMVMKRVFAQTQERLLRAHTGADRPDQPARRAP